MPSKFNLTYREAQREDLLSIISMLADDALGQTREAPTDPLPDSYISAFIAIDQDPNHKLIVVEHDNLQVGTFQLSFLPYLTHIGSWRAQIEAVRIHSGYRKYGIGTQMIEWAIEQSRLKGCKMVQLTSNKERTDAIHFYEKFGFKPSHEGLKKELFL